MRTTRMIRLTFLFTMVAVLVAGGAVIADERPRLYTNADLKTAPPPNATTNADLAKLKPVPQQGAPIAVTPSGTEGWDLVFAMLDRERENQRDHRIDELEKQIEELRAAQVNPYYGAPGYGSIFPYGSGFCNGIDCGLGPAIVNAPTNPQNTLAQRGIKTAQGLFLESRMNSQIVRSNLP